MSEELEFEGLDNENEDDNNFDDSEQKDHENLIERHRQFGASKETIEKLQNLINAKEIFSSVFFLRLLDKLENEKKEIKDKLFEFYCFLEKYLANLKSENMSNIIDLENDTKLDILSFWQKKLSKEIFQNLLQERNNLQLDDYFQKYSSELIEKGYEVKNVFQLISELTKYKPEENEENKLIIESIMSILKIYKIKGEFFLDIEKYIKDLNKDTPKLIYSIACKNQEKMNDLTKDELIEEIEKRNPIYFNEEIKNNLIRQMRVISQTYERYKEFNKKEDIKNWVKNEFPDLKKDYEENRNKVEISAKILAVISIANEIFTTTSKKKGYKLRNIQIMDVLLFISKKEDKGLIEEISTGEGKSTIICALATFLALIGKNVDIVTSALNLAKRDAKELKDFYGLFNLTVDNVENANPEPYRANIIYGTFLEYEGDFLRELTSTRNIRGNRKFEVLIVDEIDNLFIDNIDGSTRLVYSTLGYQFLSPIFVNIFFVMKTYESQFSNVFKNVISNMGMENDEKTYLLNLIQDQNFRDQNIYPILKIFVCKFLRLLYGRKQNEEIDNNNENLIENNNQNENQFLELDKTLHLPVNLIPIFDNQLEYWVDNAYKALFNFHLNKDYVVSNGVIAPVDRENTGEIEQRKVYRDGLHRMLEIKHKLRLRDETLNHTFLSHISFFHKYKKDNKLFFYGMTGTLGDENTLNVFKDENKFNSDVLFIPTYKAKRFVEFPSLLCQDEKEQIKIICQEIGFQVKNNRKILVINDSIKEAIKLKNYLQNIDANYKVGLYTRDDDKEQMKTIEKEMQIILSTNLAGRGTDIKTSPTIEENGGLHIILTSMPSNLRIEKQAYGRTSRQGNKGSGQMILLKDKFQSIKDYKDKRDQEEKKRLDNISKTMKQTLFKDILFNKYIHLLKRRKVDLTSKISEDIDERWGTFLDKYIDLKEDINDEKMNKVNLEFNKFIKDLDRDLLTDGYKEKIQNSFLNISYGYENFNKNPIMNMRYNQFAIKKERYSFAAYYYNAIMHIELANLKNNSKNPEYEIDLIKKNLLESEKILNEILEENVNICYNNFIERNKEYEGSPILQQMLNRKYLVESIIKQLQQNINVIEKYEKSKYKNSIQIFYKGKDLEDIYNYKEAKGENYEEIAETLRYIKNSGLYQIYEIYLKRNYKWYEKLLYFLKVPLEFILGVVLCVLVPGVGLAIGAALIADSVVSCLNYFINIRNGSQIDLNFADFLLNRGFSNMSRRIYYSIGRDIYNKFCFVKDHFGNKNNVQSILEDNNNNNAKFIRESRNLNKIQKFSKEKIDKYIKEEFEKIIEKQKNFIKYLLCFDDYLKNDFWKNEIKEKIIECYKNYFKKDLKNKEENIIKILKKGYKDNKYEEASNLVELSLRPIILNCIKSFDESLEKFKEIKEYNEESGLNSLEHLIRHLNPEVIDNSLAQEIVKEMKKYKIISDQNEENKYKFTISINGKTTVNFIVETDLRNTNSEKEITNLNDFSLSNISRKPIIDEEMNDRIEFYKKQFSELGVVKLNYLNKVFQKTIDSIIKAFLDDKIIFEFLEEIKQLISVKIISQLNKKIYTKLDGQILGDITSSSIKDAERQVIENFKKIFLGKGDKIKENE